MKPEGLPVKVTTFLALPALAATLLALNACSSAPGARYTPGNIDSPAADASGTAIRQSDSSAPAQVPEECKDSAVRTRVDACNPPKGPASQTPPPVNSEAAPVAPPVQTDPTVPAAADPPPR